MSFDGKRAVVCDAELQRGTAFLFFKLVYQLRFTLKTVFAVNLVDRIFGIQKRLFDELNASFVNVL